GVLRARRGGGRRGYGEGAAALRRRSAEEGERLRGGAAVPRRGGQCGAQGARRQRPVRRHRRARARVQRVPGEALSGAGGRAVRKGAESAASVRRLARLQALAKAPARLLEAGADPLRGGRLRAEERRRSAIV